MPYINDGAEWRDDRTRESRMTNDSMTMAAEKFVAVAENFLYNEAHPGFHNYDYLGWSIGQFDSTKRGSGLYVNRVEWNPDDETAIYTGMDRPVSEKVSKGDRRDENLHLSLDELERRKHDGDAEVNPNATIALTSGAPFPASPGAGPSDPYNDPEANLAVAAKQSEPAEDDDYVEPADPWDDEKADD